MNQKTRIFFPLTVIIIGFLIIMSQYVNNDNNNNNAVATTGTHVTLAIAMTQHQGNNIQNSIIHDISLVTQQPSSSSSLTDIFKKVENSVVQITSRVSGTNGSQIIINGNPLQSTRLGSGFVYEGQIITNNHVVDGAKTVDVTFVDGNTYTAKVVGADPFSDLAVLQITDNFSAENVVPLAIANSSGLQVGQQVIAIGNPFGLSDTMTTGIISQTGRLLPNPDTGFSIPNGIQTDAAINPGNSGGPLLNMQGQVVGMNAAISSSTGEFSGIGFAIPSNAVTRIVPALIKTGNYTHPWLGFSGASLTPDLAQAAGLPRNYRGVIVGPVRAGSPAEAAGLQGVSLQDINSTTPHLGDIIIAIDGHPAKRMDDIVNYIELQKSIEQKITLTVNRNGHIMDLTATLQARPSSLPQQ